MPYKVKGLTLIELIFTLGLAAIMSMIAFPHLQMFVAKQQLNSDLLKIKSTIETARNRAITEKQIIRICGTSVGQELKINDDFNCQSDWSELAVINTKNIKENQLLYRHSLDNNYKHVKWSAFQHKPYLELTPNGFTNHQNGTLYLCHKQYEHLHRAVIVSKTGRVTITQDKAKISDKCNR